jgi:hypothetical protein
MVDRRQADSRRIMAWRTLGTRLPIALNGKGCWCRLPAASPISAVSEPLTCAKNAA